MARRIGILGGTFDPIHCGHLDVAEAAHAALGLERMLVITSNIPPHRPQPVASSYHRFAMTAMAVANRPGWTADDMELRVGAPSYTSATLDRLHALGYAAGELFFILGADAFAEIESWYDYPAILQKTQFAIVSRPGHAVGALPERLRLRSVPGTCQAPSQFLIDAPTADVSSTAIRARLAAGQSIAGMVPPAVQQHIERHGLYSAGRLHGKD
jgi:nicotinate-nucleotide adenylyltransferase